MIFMIDNYDSFTFNLVQYLEVLGREVVVRRNDKVAIEEIRQMAPDAVVISPGPGRPEHAGITVDLIKELYRSFPILGVCLGHQAIGYAFGAQVVGAKRIMHGKTSPIHHDEGTIFRGMPLPFTAARYHSLAVAEETLPGSLAVSARSDDGEIMGIRHREYPLEGVQFHPESIVTESGLLLMENFLTLADESKGSL